MPDPTTEADPKSLLSVLFVCLSLVTALVFIGEFRKPEPTLTPSEIELLEHYLAPQSDRLNQDLPGSCTECCCDCPPRLHLITASDAYCLARS